MLTPLQEHIELIARHEAEFVAHRTRAERTTDTVARFVGSLRFVGAHLVLFGCWLLWDLLARAEHLRHPHLSTLSSIVALESILIGSFILMRQTRISRRADERDHLMLQLLLLTEKEATALLNINRKIAQQMGLERAANSQEIRELAKHTSIEDLAQTIKESLVETLVDIADENEDLEGQLLG
jgi:uncharacterized membrane protein